MRPLWPLWLAVIFQATAVALLIVVIVVDTDGRAVVSVFGAVATPQSCWPPFAILSLPCARDGLNEDRHLAGVAW